MVRISVVSSVASVASVNLLPGLWGVNVLQFTLYGVYTWILRWVASVASVASVNLV